jgi:hypothetical protein
MNETQTNVFGTNLEVAALAEALKELVPLASDTGTRG